MSQSVSCVSPDTPIYLDNNATTPVALEVFEAMVPFLTQHFGNPSSAYRLGRHVAEALARAREQVANLLDCEPANLVFTSSGTESDNSAILSALHTTRKRHIVTTAVEHSAVHKLCEYLETKGYTVTWLPVARDGTLAVEQVVEAIHEGTAIVSLMWANNETGVLFPIDAIAQVCRERGVLFHTDAVQAVGKVPISLSETPIDFLALSGHKLHGPKGVGALYIRPGTRFQPFLLGGSQEKNRRASTENTASIVGLGQAAELAGERLRDYGQTVRGLRDRFESRMLEMGVERNGHPELRLPNTSSLRFPGRDGAALQAQLDERGICVGTGSACTSGSSTPSHVLDAMGLSAAEARSSLRFSFSTQNTTEQVDHVVEQLRELLQ